MAHYFSELGSPVGTLLLVGDGELLTGLYMDEQNHRPTFPDSERNDRCFKEVQSQLKAYFAGTLHVFDLPLAGHGTEFQQMVWKALRKIPYGSTQTYGELAKRVGNPNASRAVGMANGRNPIGIIVPCHRVIGTNGTLTGYAGGVQRKQWLLEHERRYARAT
jgi:methylated-DNA-[protein]-cysteine S-methyltransferase